MSTISIIIHGARGRMGRRILALAAEEPHRFTIRAGVDLAPGSLADLGVPVEGPILAHLPTEPGSVVIDFSHAGAAAAVLAHCADHDMPCAIGTTGIDPGALDRHLTAAAARIPVIVAPNMSVGVNVVIAAAAQIAAALGLDYDVELVESHHRHKLDAPSGTAWAIADAVAGATCRSRADMVHGRNGMVGERRRGEIGIHAVRMGDVVGDHQLTFCGNGERITLGHVAHTRDIFVRGALRAAVFLAEAKPGRYGMADVLGIR